MFTTQKLIDGRANRFRGDTDPPLIPLRSIGHIVGRCSVCVQKWFDASGPLSRNWKNLHGCGGKSARELWNERSLEFLKASTLRDFPWMREVSKKSLEWISWKWRDTLGDLICLIFVDLKSSLVNEKLKKNLELRYLCFSEIGELLER